VEGAAVSRSHPPAAGTGCASGTSAALPVANLYEDAAAPATGERFETLLAHRNLVVERILSSSRTVPAEFRQDQDEWVLLVQGTATLEVDGRTLPLKAGDHVFLPAGTPHTVRQVSEGAVWLAVHLHPDPGSGVR
jgi:cupin 2 domain-containing protein